VPSLMYSVHVGERSVRINISLPNCVARSFELRHQRPHYDLMHRVIRSLAFGNKKP
jgi:hypothetical protein